jgi:molybdenum cofactor cytidylyltransferase
VIAGIVLAAGRSTRMGTSKALLRAPGGSTFVQCAIASLTEGGAAFVVVVGRPEDAELRDEVQKHSGEYVENPLADAGGQLSSLLAGLAAADRSGVRGVIVLPVDAPLVLPATVRMLLAIFKFTRAAVVRPRHAGRHGHPVIFSRAVFDDLRRADPAAGAKAVLRRHASAIVNVDVDDEAVLGDVDTPESYRAMFDSGPQS